MKREERRQAIMDLLVGQGNVSLDALADQFGVSKMTVHRDLDELEAAGLLRKIRGGASIESGTQFEADFQFRKQRSVSEKSQIAAMALSLVEPGMTIILNDGTTAGLLGDLLFKKRPLTVITNNMAVIETLRSQNGITLLALGGAYSRKFNGFFGLITEQSLSRVRADLAFLSTPAVRGVKTFHMDEEVIRTKRLMIAAADKPYLMVDNQKFGKTALHHFADLADFAGVIVDSHQDHEILKKLKQSKINIIVAGEVDP